MKKPRKKPDAMDELATKILRTNHPLVLDNIVWLRDAIADALRAVERRERRRSSALLRERADAAAGVYTGGDWLFLPGGDRIDAIRNSVIGKGRK